MNISKKQIAMGIVEILLILIIFYSLISGTKGIFGYTFRIVVSNSMEPTIEHNSICVVKDCDIEDINIDDIICFNYSQDIIHRVVSIDNNSQIELHTKGDANDREDSIIITSDMLVGKVVYTTTKFSNLINKYAITPGEVSSIEIFKNIIIIVIILTLITTFIQTIIKEFIRFKHSNKEDNTQENKDTIYNYIQLVKNKESNIIVRKYTNYRINKTNKSIDDTIKRVGVLKRIINKITRRKE